MLMPRTLTVCALLVLPLLCRAEDRPKETVIRLTVEPRAAPRPPLKYQLLPELAEMNPGNPIQAYLKCFSEQTTFFFSKKFAEERGKWLEMPLKDLPAEQLRHYGRPPLDQADHAARLDTPDWQVLLPLKREGAYLRLADVQQVRVLATALQVRFRGQVAGRHFDEALGTAKTQFALSRHLGEHPTLIADVIAVFVALQAIGPLEEMLQQPGCPNLYWALTYLPSPFIDLRKGVQSEPLLLAPYTALLDDKEPMSMAQLQRFMRKAQELVAITAEGSGPSQKDLAKWLARRVGSEDHLRAARKRLVEAGLDADRVRRFPAMQVVFLDEKLAFEALREEHLGTMLLPYWQVPAGRPKADARDEDRSLLEPLGAFPIEVVRLRHVQLEQRLALLRCVEAVRLYAAEHDGKLPAKLSEISLPLPIDPVTGKPFAYQLDGKTATIQGTAPRSVGKTPGVRVRYEVTIKK
jgi:hypothetical protein